MHAFRSRLRCRRGVTIIELMIACGLMAVLGYTSSMVYFSVLHTYNDKIWKIPPYDNATAAVKRLSRELPEGMLIESAAADRIVLVMPLKNSERENVLTLTESGYVLSQGERVCFYLSDATGALDATGNCLWKAVKPVGGTDFVPRIMIASSIHPELNPIDPATNLPRPMFTYRPDEVRLWGVEMWMTSIATVHGETRTQTAHTEVYLRNL